MNPLTVLLFAALAGGAYYAVIFGPLYLDNLGVKEAAEIGITAARANEDVVATAVLKKINFGPNPPGSHLEETDSGDLVEKPGLGLTEENVSVVKDEATKTVRITIDYARTVRLVPTQSTRTVQFHVEKEGPIP
jgi:hypothetical protein